MVASTIRPAGRPRAATRPAVFPAATLLVAVLLVLHLGVGSVALTPGEVLAALLGRPFEESHRQIAVELRLPRGLIAAASGAMLGLAGAILQALLRNPLAEPGLTGVSAGSVLLAVLWLGRGAGLADPSWTLPAVALLGGLGGGFLVYALSRGGSVEPARLALTGVVVSAVLGACASLWLLLHQQFLGSILLWLIGSLNGRVWVHWAALWPWALVAIPCGLGCAGLANALHLGEEIAGGLGLRVERDRAMLLFVAAWLTAAAVGVVGAVGFIGLIGPHIARRLVGDDARRVFPLSALVGASVLLGADIVAQGITLYPPVALNPQRAGLPVGAVTALLGAPFFLYLVRREAG
jgi:iron complex transport system permease protein